MGKVSPERRNTSKRFHYLTAGMDGKRTSSLIFLCLMCGFKLETEAQTNGFRGGSKSYEIHVEASTMGTNLHYELPESKVKAASKQDWQVDNDNAEMLAMNSPVLATVNVKHPKFSMKGQWPGYKTSFKLPKDVSVAAKRTDFSKFNQGRHEKIGKKSDQHDTDFSGSAQDSRHQTTADRQLASSGVLLSKLAGQLFKGRKPGKKPRQEGGVDMSKITKFLLPIAGLKNVDLKNPNVTDAMKGVIKHARKVVDEAKTVLNDAANFVTKVRKLVKVTKDHSKMHRKITKASPVAKETSPTRQTDSTHSSKNLSPLSQEQSKMDSVRLKVAEKSKENDSKSRQRSPQRNLDLQKHNLKAKHSGSRENEAKLAFKASAKGVKKRSYLDSSERNARNRRNLRVHHRGLGETLESILSTINGLKGLLKYH